MNPSTHRLVWLSLVLAVTVGSLSAAPPRRKPERRTRELNEWINDHPEPTKRKPKLEEWLHKTFESKVLKREVGYSIIYPDGYIENLQAEDARRYPVIYFLHDFLKNESTGYDVAAAFLKARKEEGYPPAFLVFPNCGRQGFYMDRESLPAETFFIREFVPYIDKTYRTISYRHGRALEGVGMGADGALKFLVKYPRLFSSAVCYGGRFLERGGRENSPAHLTHRDRRRLAGNVRIRLVVSQRDGAMSYTKHFHGVLQRLGVPHEYEVLQHGRDRAGHYYRQDARDGWAFQFESLRMFTPTTQPTTAPARDDPYATATTQPATQPAEPDESADTPATQPADPVDVSNDEEWRRIQELLGD